MAIETVDNLVKAIANNSARLIFDKASIANMTAGGYGSLWRATGQPAQAAIPTTAAVPTSATTGAISFPNQTAPIASYITWLYLVSANAGTNVEFHDRLAHIGGFVLNSITTQTVTGMNLATLGVVSARLGDANYSDVQWWLEVYSDGGATASNATINVTYNDLSTGNLNVVAVGGTLRASRMIPLTPQIPTAQQGLFIKGINSVTLSASTTVAGNFGFTATRSRTAISLDVANKGMQFDWAALGMPLIANDTCLMMLMNCITTSTGVLRGSGKISNG